MFLSIIISVYNLEHFGADCIESLVNIKLPIGNYKIIIIDDGSTDFSLSIIKLYPDSYSQIKCFFQGNRGVGAARNLGLSHAISIYLWFLNGDDYIESVMVSKCIGEAITTDADFLALDSTPVKRDGTAINWANFMLNFWGPKILTGPQFYYDNFEKSYIWLYFFKRDIFMTHRLSFEDPIRMQDGETMPRIITHSLKVKCLEGKIVCYRFRMDSAVNNKDEKARAHFYFSMVIVAHQTRNLQQSLDSNDLMFNDLSLKLNQLNQMLFTSLILNNYSDESNLYFIRLLKDYKLLPFMKTNGFTLKRNLAYNLISSVANISHLKGRDLYQ